jgi:hypothetical protein
MAKITIDCPDGCVAAVAKVLAEIEREARRVAPDPFCRRYALYCLVFRDGKKYIGVTGQSPQALLSAHLTQAKRGNKRPVHDAIRRIGKPSIYRLCIGSLDYIKDIEVKAIAAFRTQDRQHGYNCRAGGAPIPYSNLKLWRPIFKLRKSMSFLKES